MVLKIDSTQKVQVIPNGVDPVFFKNHFFAKNNENSLKLVAVTRLIERKGIQDILIALSELRDPDICLQIIGTGNYENHLKRLCQQLSLEKVVTFYGFCHPKKLPELLIQKDVFILTPYAEAFGNVFAEAMACGLPVIGSDIGGISDLVGKENGFLPSPGNVPQIKQAILNMKNSEKLRVQMGQANKKKMKTNYQWEIISQKHIAIYSE